MDFLNYVATVIPLGQVCHLWLSFEFFFSFGDRAHFIPFPSSLHSLVLWQLTPHLLSTLVPWTCPPLVLFVETDVSDEGWGMQASLGLQA